MEVPLLVGTFSDAEALLSYADNPGVEGAPDLIEVRWDQISPTHYADCLNACTRIETRGIQVLATIRLESDGGMWKAPDEDRRELFTQAMTSCSWVDVEESSKIARDVVAAAHRAGRKVIVSHHDFATTAPLSELEAVVQRCVEIGADVAKLATMTSRPEHHDILVSLLREHEGDVPLCVIGMGATGLPLRLYLPAIGSALAYAYLDRPSAPGQLPCSQMLALLRLQVPSYNQRYLSRTQALRGA